MEGKQLDSLLLREGEQFITYLITDDKGEKSILKIINPKYLKYDGRYEKIKEQFQFEKQLLNLLEIEEIPKYIDSGENFLHLSYISGKDLKEYAKARELTLNEIENIVCNIAEIVKKLHKHRVVHCDIKPENIIYDGEKVFLIDFGSAAFQGDESIYIQGSKGFSAPEIYVKRIKRDIKDDIYSITALYYWLLNKKIYINDTQDNEIFKIGLADKREERFKSTDELISAIKKIRRE